MTIQIPRSGIEAVGWVIAAIQFAIPLAVYVWALRARPERSPVKPAVMAWVWAVLGTVAFMVTFQPLNERLFGARLFFFGARMLDAAFFIVAPALGAVVVFAEVVLRPRGVRASRRAVLTLGALTVISGGLGVEMHLLCPYRLRVERQAIRLPGVRPSDEPVRIALIADLQTDAPGAWEDRVIERVNAERPDIVLMLGDYYQDSVPDGLDRDLAALKRVLSAIRAPFGVFAIEGDFEDIARLQREVEGTPVVPLLGERRSISVRGQWVHLYGFGNHMLDKAADPIFRAARAAAPGAGPHIVLTHQPDILYRLRADGGPDLIAAGHTHGGQIQLPFIGPLVNFQNLPLAFSDGLHEVEGHRLYVSRGIGMERFDAPRVRLLCPPEITLITLLPAADAGNPRVAERGRR